MKLKRSLIIGCVKERMSGEGRIAIDPPSIREILDSKPRRFLHFVAEPGLGEEIGWRDKDWLHAGASVVRSREAIYRTANLIVKVKQPLPDEAALYQRDQWLFCFLHPDGNRELVGLLYERGVNFIPFENFKPILNSMSKVAGPKAFWIGLEEWRKIHSEDPASFLKLCVLGGAGVFGRNAVGEALHFGIPAERIFALDLSVKHVRADNGREFFTLDIHNRTAFLHAIKECTLFILAALGPKGAPKLLKFEHLRMLAQGSVIVDGAIDEGGNAEFSTVTSWANPARRIGEIVYIGLPNIPGQNPKISSPFLINSVRPVLRDIAVYWPDIPPEWRYFPRV